jgi:serine/threonine protein kinase/Flp pilus assembly protein TadD
MNTAEGRLQAIDEAIEQFEESWRQDSDDLIEQVAAAAGLAEDSELLAELVRVDIDRRYAAGEDVELSNYFQRFPVLLQDRAHVAAICFEDYRVRKQRRRACPANRWAGFSGVESEAWFRELQSVTQVTALAGHQEFPSTASFISSQLMQGESMFAPAAPPHVAEKIGDFELVALLGEGTFSRVYLARQSSLGRRYVAAKVVDRPMQEPYNLSRLQHTGIVPLYSCHEADGRWVLCMPYSGATTLARWLREHKEPQDRNGISLRQSIESAQTRLTSHSEDKPIGLGNPPLDVVQSLRRWHHAASGPLQHLQSMSSGRLALWIFRRLASALSHAHQRGLVHGDLKPANILIRNDGEPALIDFNLSQSTESRQRAWIGGTMPYLAREQLQQLLAQSAGPPRPEYDIHALGVIMFEILEGRLPFRSAANSGEEELRAALASHEEPVEFSGRVGTPGLRAIVLACINPGSGRGYPTAVELLEDIDREIANQPLRHTTESLFKGRFPKTLRRYPRAFSGGFITAIAMVAIGFLGLWLALARQAQERLGATEVLARLQEVSDEACGSLLYARMEQNSHNLEKAQTILENLEKAMGCRPGESFAEAWERMLPVFTVAEQFDAQYCIATATVIAASTRYGELRQRAGADTATPELDKSLAVEILSVLPAEFREKWNFQSLISDEWKPSDVATTEFGLIPPVGESTTEKKLVVVDSLLRAVHLASQGRAEEGLLLLEGISPPASLANAHWMLRGLLLHGMGRFREACSAFSVILSEQPKHENARLCRGLSFFNLGRHREAESDFSALVEQNEDLPDAWLQRSFARQSMKEFDGAIADLGKAIELRPESNRYYLARARLYGRLKRGTEAEGDWKKARELPARSVEDRVAQASALMIDNPEVALAGLKTAEQYFGPQPRILQTMAHILSERLGREPESLEVLNRLIAANPSYQKALAGRAVLHARTGNYDGAIEDIGQLAKTQQSLPADLMFQVACAWSLCSKTREQARPQAWRWLTKAIVAGYGADLLDTDRDLEPLREDPEFAVIRRTAWLLEGKKTDAD